MWVKRLARGRPGVASLCSSLTVLSERDCRRRQRYYEENPHTHQAISHFRTPSHTLVRTIAGPLRSSRFRHRRRALLRDFRFDALDRPHPTPTRPSLREIFSCHAASRVARPVQQPNRGRRLGAADIPADTPPCCALSSPRRSLTAVPTRNQSAGRSAHPAPRSEGHARGRSVVRVGGFYGVAANVPAGRDVPRPNGWRALALAEGCLTIAAWLWRSEWAARSRRAVFVSMMETADFRDRIRNEGSTETMAEKRTQCRPQHQLPQQERTFQSGQRSTRPRHTSQPAWDWASLFLRHTGQRTSQSIGGIKTVSLSTVPDRRFGSRYFRWREAHPRFGRVERRDHKAG